MLWVISAALRVELWSASFLMSTLVLLGLASILGLPEIK